MIRVSDNGSVGLLSRFFVITFYSTGVDELALNFGTSQQQPLQRLTAAEARRYLQEGQFPPGSMGPKIEAALSYLEHGGREVIITSPEKIPEALRGKAGTRIAPQPA